MRRRRHAHAYPNRQWWGRLVWRPRPWRQWSLRSRLVFAIAALTAAALIVVSGVGVLLLRSYLTQKIDERLVTQSPLVAQVMDTGRFGRPPPEVGQKSRPPRVAVDQWVYLYGANGSLESADAPDQQGLSPPRLEPIEELIKRARDSRPYTVDAQDAASRWRVIVVPQVDGSQTSSGPGPRPLGDPATDGVAVVAVSLRETDAIANQMLVIDVVVSVLALLLLGVAAAAVSHLGLRPLTRMQAISAEITAGNLSRRVEDADPHTEAGRLGIALNTMLSRIESEVAARTASEQRLRQFLADASHELRTPLTSIRGFAELYRRGGAPAGPVLDETMGRIESEAARMGLLVEDLLLLARLDLQRPMQLKPVDLLGLAADTIRDAHARVPHRFINLEALDERFSTFEPISVLGDEHRLRQVAINLVNNALQHTPEGTHITVRLGRWRPDQRIDYSDRVMVAVGEPIFPTQAMAVLEVADNGHGVPAQHASRIFERLYRVDRSRTRGSGGGSGLGLSIVAAIVCSHGGRVELETNDRGATFRVLLPTVAVGPPVIDSRPSTRQNGRRRLSADFE